MVMFLDELEVMDSALGGPLVRILRSILFQLVMGFLLNQVQALTRQSVHQTLVQTNFIYQLLEVSDDL